MSGDLTAKRLRELLTYCAESGDFIWRVKIGARAIVGNVAGTISGSGYRMIRIRGVGYLAQKLVFLYLEGKWPSGQCDHIDGDRLNNRRSNLRICSHAENCRNKGRQTNNTSGVTGVTRHKSTERWKAGIVVNGEYLYLGLFETIESAAEARRAAEIIHGFSQTDRLGHPKTRREKERARKLYAERNASQ